jgi:hypothetical protein
MTPVCARVRVASLRIFKTANRIAGWRLGNRDPVWKRQAVSAVL